MEHSGEESLFVVGGFGLFRRRLAFAGRQVSWLLSVILAFMLSVRIAGADVFNMPPDQTSLQFVNVGDPGNTSDTATGSLYGSVSYAYRMGTYDVTVGQYCQFLNACAKTDTYGLYYSGMATAFSTIGITQSGSSGDFAYTVTGSYSQAANCPIFEVSWGDAARFCNWLQNGQPSFPAGIPGEVAGSTETGAYALNGANTNGALLAVTRGNGARYFVPSESEWYKAAYYKSGNTNAGYWTYATQSNTAPINTLPDTGNHANFYDLYGTGNHGYTDPTNYLTPVGAFSASPGAYGAFDMNGDVYQWNEAVVSGSWRGLRGGAYYGNSKNLKSDARLNGDPLSWFTYLGFRVASVPLLAGDANGDGTVNIDDLSKVLTNYDKTGMAWASGDFNGDGTVSVSDLGALLTNYNKAVSTGDVKTVPEPSSIALLGIGLAAAMVFLRRSQRYLLVHE